LAATLAIGATFATGPLTTITAQAAVPQAIQHTRFVGTGSLSGAGSNTFVDSIHDATSGDVGNATATHAGSGNTAPNPAGRPVSTTGNFSGFLGLTHLDQRLAGTGKYANTQFSLEPPDQGLCVGNGYVLESVNVAFAVYNTHGAQLTAPQAYNQFFNLVPEFNRVTGDVGDFLSDPKCDFDVATQRWIMTILQADAPGLCLNGPFDSVVPCGRSSVLVAVSQSPNPTLGWNIFSIDTTDDGTLGTPNNSTPAIGCPCFGDQPLLGLNADAVVITTNEYGTALAGSTNPANPETGGQVYALSKLALVHASSGSLPNVVHINAGALPMHSGECCAPFDSLQPAASPTPDSQSRGVEYLMSSFTNNPAISHAINVWALTGTNTLGRSHPDLDLQRTAIRSESYGYDAPFKTPGLGTIVVDQKDGSKPLADLLTTLGAPTGLEQVNANDVRMNQVVYARGKLWGAFNTAVLSAPGGPMRSAIAYFVVIPNSEDGRLRAEMANQGYVSVAGNSTLFPSMGINASGNGAIGFSVVGPDYYPSAAYVRITDGQVRGNIVISGAGIGPDDGFTGYPAETGSPSTVGRWGDYSAAVAAPDGSIWMASEYIPDAPRTLLANWGTFITHIPASSSDGGGDH
jgi:hypothetical protein